MLKVLSYKSELHLEERQLHAELLCLALPRAHFLRVQRQECSRIPLLGDVAVEFCDVNLSLATTNLLLCPLLLGTVGCAFWDRLLSVREYREMVNALGRTAIQTKGRITEIPRQSHWLNRKKYIHTRFAALLYLRSKLDQSIDNYYFSKQSE